MRISEFYLKTSGNHKIFVRTTGKKGAFPILFIHGGPGGSSKSHHLNYLPSREDFFTIQFDQRGSGASLPAGEIKENTTSDLIKDIESIRERLKIDRWAVLGGSWGSTLALLYAQTHPERIQVLFLRNIFLARKKDLEWMIERKGVGNFLPDLLEQAEEIAKNLKIKRDSFFFKSAYQRFLQTKDPLLRKKIARLALGFEYTILSLDLKTDLPYLEDIDDNLLNSTKIFLHYCANDFFIKKNQILDNIQRIKDIPVFIFHGRYDLVCPPEQAYTLYKSLPKAKLFWDNFAGHSLSYNGKMLMKETIKDFYRTKRKLLAS